MRYQLSMPTWHYPMRMNELNIYKSYTTFSFDVDMNVLIDSWLYGCCSFIENISNINNLIT